MAKHEFGIMQTPPRANERYDAYGPQKTSGSFILDYNGSWT